jgi:hypothetical protein
MDGKARRTDGAFMLSALSEVLRWIRRPLKLTQNGKHSPLCVVGQEVETGGPYMGATRARHRDDRDAFHEEGAADVLALGTVDR